MPYRIDLAHAPADTFDRLVELDALDIEVNGDRVAAILPDAIDAEALARVLGTLDVRVGPAFARDDGSVWLIRTGAVRAGGFDFIPADWPPQSGAIRLIDGPAFGTGLHPSTALCLEALRRELDATIPASVLDIGTGSGILALAALRAGAEVAVGIDIDPDAVRVAAKNAAANAVPSRLQLVRGGPEVLAGRWPLVLANVLAAPLADLAPDIVKLVAHKGRLVLGGIRTTLAADLDRAYRHFGMQPVYSLDRDGWRASVLQASW